MSWKGDDHCEFLNQTPEKWGESVRIYLNAYKRFFSRLSKKIGVSNMGEKLLKYYQYITSGKSIQGKMALA
jgi:hypothetical protein